MAFSSSYFLFCFSFSALMEHKNPLKSSWWHQYVSRFICMRIIQAFKIQTVAIWTNFPHVDLKVRDKNNLHIIPIMCWNYWRLSSFFIHSTSFPSCFFVCGFLFRIAIIWERISQKTTLLFNHKKHEIKNVNFCHILMNANE